MPFKENNIKVISPNVNYDADTGLLDVDYEYSHTKVHKTGDIINVSVDLFSEGRIHLIWIVLLQIMPEKNDEHTFALFTLSG